MGGMEIILLGNRNRTTRDVDIAVDVRLADLLATLAQDVRVYRPSRIAAAGSGVARIYVLTGGTNQEPVRRLAVEVDLILPGHQGTPRSLTGATEVLSLNTEFGPRSWYTLSLQYLFRSKLRAYNQREGRRDFNDLVWLCFNFPDNIRQFSPRLDEGLRSFFFAAYRQTGPPESELGFIYGVLGRPRPLSSSSSSSQGRSRR
ncbi:hypothetical protein B0J18DRAFT_193716 [Chaetomium sp. MPI-SDFR-AT-0129]|nr:hypothetical protein B0J18DRAFT_193716 [Chaetomium sp. MPI-SDFR-AT-0129]